MTVGAFRALLARWFLFGALWLIAAGSVLPASGQTVASGTLRGTVKDSMGAGVWEADVQGRSRTEVSFLVDETTVRNLPLNSRRWEDFVLLTPAVVEDGGFGLVSYRGLSGLYNNNLVDGADNNQAFFSESRGRTRPQYAYSLASIKEFQVITQNYSAEFGRAAGGAVNAVTQSAGNDLHGEAFSYFRDDALLAPGPLPRTRRGAR